jgi:DNA-binding MarR family transcriptional regulator
MTADHVDAALAQWMEQRPEMATPAHALSKRIARIAWQLQQATATEIAGLDINLAEYDVLISLLRQGPPYELSPTELSQAGLVTTTAMTKRLDGLEQRDLVRRRASETDRRALHIALTDDGVRVARAAAQARDRAVGLVMAPLTDDEARRLADGLRRVTLAAEAG